MFKVIIAVVTHDAIKKKAATNAATGRKLRGKDRLCNRREPLFAPVAPALLFDRADLPRSDYQNYYSQGVELRVVCQIPAPDYALESERRRSIDCKNYRFWSVSSVSRVHTCECITQIVARHFFIVLKFISVPTTD